MAEQNNQQKKGGQQQDANQLIQVRYDKLHELQANGKNPFEITKYDVTHHSTDIKDNFESLEGQEVTVAGRMMFKRVMGKASFCNIQDLQGNIQVYISNAVEKEIQIMVNASPDKETGGCLFGSYDRDHNSIYVYYMKPAPEDSIHTSVSFVRGFKGLTDEYKRITKLTYNQVRYLGEWHSHPNALNTPSDTDKKQFEELREEQQSQDLPFVQIIHGNNGLFVTAVM